MPMFGFRGPTCYCFGAILSAAAERAWSQAPTQEPSATMKLNLGQLQERFEHLQDKGSTCVKSHVQFV
jgi:hypothetical protein